MGYDQLDQQGGGTAHGGFVEEKSLVGQQQLGLVSQQQPSLVGHQQPSLVGQQQPSLVGQQQPSLVGQQQPLDDQAHQVYMQQQQELQQQQFQQQQQLTQPTMENWLRCAQEVVRALVIGLAKTVYEHRIRPNIW